MGFQNSSNEIEQTGAGKASSRRRMTPAVFVFIAMVLVRMIADDMIDAGCVSTLRGGVLVRMIVG
jgi:hypothetical protein